MKKNAFLLTLLLPFAAIGLNACNNQKTRLTFGTMLNTEEASNPDTKLITYDDLVLKMSPNSSSSNENFIIVVADPTGGCVCWQIFMPKLKQFIKETHYNVYQINLSELNNVDTFGLSAKKGYTSLALVKGSKIISQYPDCEVFANAAAVKAEIDKYFEAPNIYYTDQDHLNDHIKIESKSLVYYYRSGCSDCSYVTPDVLVPFTNEHHFTLKMFAIDLQELYDDAKAHPELGDQTDYQIFKNEFNLAELRSPDFGYGKGVVPTFQYYEDRHLKDASVYFNDTIEKTDTGFKVKDSYYTQTRKTKIGYTKGVATPVLQGLSLKDDEVNTISYQGEEFYMWKHESAAKYHTPLLESFLNIYSQK